MKNLKWWVLVVSIFCSQNGFSTVRICGNHTYPDGHSAKVCHYFYANEIKCDNAEMLAIVSQGFPGGWTCQSDNFGIATTSGSDVHLFRAGDGTAFVIANGKRTPVGSDAFTEFTKKMQLETANMRMNNQAIQDQFDAFLNTDNGYVSDARLQQLSMDLGVPIEVEGSGYSRDELRKPKVTPKPTSRPGWEPMFPVSGQLAVGGPPTATPGAGHPTNRSAESGSQAPAGQRAAAVPVGSQPKGAPTLKNLRRSGVLMSDSMQRMVFNPANTRGMTSLSVRSLNRDLNQNDKVYFVDPLSYAILNTENINLWGISYFWEIVSTDQGILMAIPVPNIESYTRAPVACPCDTKHNGTCTTTGFCFYTLEPDKCVMKPIIVEDPKLCITLKTAENGLTDINFINTFSAQSNGQNVTVVVRGNISPNPIERELWASVFVPGAGCFLEGNFDVTMADKQASAAKIRNILSANGIAGGFQFGIKERGIK